MYIYWIYFYGFYFYGTYFYKAKKTKLLTGLTCVLSNFSAQLPSLVWPSFDKTSV
jgi:hypothetical protein